MSCTILILYYSLEGSTARLARQIARGVESAGGESILRTAPSLHRSEDEPPDDPHGAPVISDEDWNRCDGLILGSPTRFGNMASALKRVIDNTAGLWASGTLIGKPAAVFTSSSSQHGGQESTLLSMMLPLLHHGMLITGVPYSLPAVHATRSGGGPYGASHIATADQGNRLTAEEKDIAFELGRRVCGIAQRLTIEGAST